MRVDRFEKIGCCGAEAPEENLRFKKGRRKEK
jgi:hypothetical protein